MLKNRLLLISIITIIFIAVFHYLALKNSWYWTVKWIDIPVHILGGFWVAITVLWISLNIKHIDSINGYKKRALLVMLIPVLVVGISWEIFELIFKITNLHDVGYWSDTLSDILNGFIGGIIAFLYFTKNKKAKSSVMDKNVAHDFVVIL